MSTGAASLVAGRLPLLSISLCVCLELVQAAVVDQLPSMVSLVWALKGRNISTWLCTVLHCSGYTVCYCTAMAFMINLNVVFKLFILIFLPASPWCKLVRLGV